MGAAVRMAESKYVYIRLHDESGKHKDVIQQHRVWDSALFIASMQEQHQGTPQRQVKPEDRRIVTMATEDDYKAFRK